MSAMGSRLVDARVVDLFAGSGALGLEALSRGADHVVFVERARGAQRVIRANVELLGAQEATTLVSDDVFRFLGRSDEPYDLALADPPYRTGDAARLIESFRRAPFAGELWLEHPSREPLPLPEGAETRRYGDTALTTLTAES